ncbi:family 16 glycosylhydrolase [Fulvivirga lutea]|uniref:Family 16 glycosylhydrolase n=1 Tax=Fulvivirga lutea TaxID=2810512 RepID=A0A975A127_9BACT|nr:family 16 glycosylhydrolase [Fulvivirga lutea]QSE97436.1 family 16 glycosylhydrolase [Fulvivirga lutea]
MPNKPLLVLLVNILFCFKIDAQTCTTGATGAVPSNGDYVLIWADEFDADGAVCSDNWHHQTQLIQGDSWANGERQHYTDEITNSFVENGFLTITAKKESYFDQGVTKDYTSARLNSKFAFTYGKVEVRAKLPEGIGTWPAIWTLGTNINEDGGYWDDNIDEVNWPACGEIDIMEHWGDNQNVISSALHTPSSFGGTVNYGSTIGSDVSNTFHVYSMIWDENQIEFSMDGIPFYTYNPATKNDATWPFYRQQYLLLNVAIAANVVPEFMESSMVIDYVRVYQNYDEDETDNLPIPLVSAPQPTNSAVDVLSLFSDSYTNIPDVTFANPEREVYSDVVDIDSNPTLRYLDINNQLVDLSTNLLDVSNQDYLNFDYWSPNTTELNLVFIDQNGNESSHEIAIALEDWQGVTIATTDISGTVNTTALEQIRFEGNGTVYLDNLYFFIDPDDDTPDPVPQTITFNPVPDISIDEGSFELEASASSGLDVEFTTFSTELEIVGSIATLLRPGTVVVTAEQPGNDEYLPAESITHIFCVYPSKPVITQSENSTDIILESSSEVGNRWYLNGNILGNEKNQTLNVEEDGFYTVQVTIDACKSPFSDEYSTLITSVNSRENRSIKVFPNPATDIIQIEYINELENIVLMDAMGRSLPINPIKKSNKIVVDIEFLPDGIYYLHVTESSHNQVFRISKR